MPNTKLKNYIGISRDHSGSMRHIRGAAARDYNQTISSLKETATAEQIDTIISVVKCGYGSVSRVKREVTNSSIVAVQPMLEREYEANAPGTPLFDSIGELIDMFESTPDANDPNVSFLVMAITDGAENDSRKWNKTLVQKIKVLQATDRWTFIFRVPNSYKGFLTNLGIPDGNILEWEQTEQGVQQATQATSEAFKSFYSELKTGKKSTSSFYKTDLSNINVDQIKSQLIDISTQVQFWPVLAQHNSMQIRDFCEAKSGAKMLRGAGFYELTKKEEVQEYKQIAIRDRITNAVYTGVAARDLLGLPRVGTIVIKPGDHANYDVFIQSTSVNRKLLEGMTIMYWPTIGVKYTEGKSA